MIHINFFKRYTFFVFFFTSHVLKFQVSEIQNNWANFTQTLHKTVKKFVQMKNHAIQEKDILTRGPWATSLTWVTLAHMKIFFEFKYTFHFLLPHLTLWSIDFNKLAMYYVRKLSCKFQLILTRVSQSPRGPLPTYWYTQTYRWNEARFQPVKYINGVPFSSNCYING